MSAMRLAAAVLLLLAPLLMGAVGTPPNVIADLTDPVPGHPGVTYLDLLHEAVPSIALNAADKQYEGHLAHSPMRHLAGKGLEGDPPDPLTAQFAEPLTIKAGGKTRLAVIFDLGDDPDRAQDTAMLALFDDSPKPKLLDFADVGIDRDTTFDDHPFLNLGPGDQGLVTVSEHDDSDENYVGYLLVQVRGDKLSMIDTFTTFSVRMCSWENEETPTFTATPVAGSPYATINIVVADVTKRTGQGGCNDETHPKAGRRSFHATDVWNAAKGRYVTTSSTMGALDKANAAAM